METLRRLVFAVTVFLVAFLVFALWRRGDDSYGLLNLLRGEKPGQAAAEVVAAAKPKLDLGEIPLLAAMNEEFAKLSAAVLPSVVSITTKTVRRGQTGWHPFFGLVTGRPEVIPGLGSGAIISKEGHVVTNYHVIADVSEVVVTTNDNRKFPARILGASRERDIALLKIEGGGDFPALAFANSDEARVGQVVFAVGNPFGLSGTVTQGIISAKDRHLSDSQLDYLQTDTVINPGNSGGPLVNIRGEIVGINVAIYQGDQNVRAWQGVGLAVPANDAKTIVDAVLRQAPAVSTGYLGLELSAEAVVLDRSLGGTRTGAYVTDLDPGSPAAQAGLVPGDVITALNGRGFRSPADLLKAIRALPPGSEAKVTVVRDGRVVDVPVRIGTRPDAR